MSVSWLAQIVFFGGYFIAWLQHAFDPLTNVSAGAHTFIVITAIAALVIAILLLVDNRGIYTRRTPPTA